MKPLVIASEENCCEKRNPFDFNLKYALAILIMIITASFGLGGIFFNAKNLPKRVEEVKIEVASMKSDIKNLTVIVLEIQKCLLNKK